MSDSHPQLQRYAASDTVTLEAPGDNPTCSIFDAHFGMVYVQGTVSPEYEPVTIKVSSMGTTHFEDAAYVWESIFVLNIFDLPSGCHDLIAYHTNNPGVNHPISILVFDFWLETFEKMRAEAPIQIMMPADNPGCKDAQAAVPSPIQVLGLVFPTKQDVTIQVYNKNTNEKVYERPAVVHGRGFSSRKIPLDAGCYRVVAFQSDAPTKKHQVDVLVGAAVKPAIAIKKLDLASSNLQVEGELLPHFEPVTVEVTDSTGKKVRRAAHIRKGKFAATVKVADLKPGACTVVVFQSKNPSVKDGREIKL